jgi:PAS domain S-box-containing protein
MKTRIKILFAEDVAMDYEFAKITIQSEGIAFEDVRVDSATDFKEQLKVFKPDLVISDYEMPGFNGKQALDLTKKHDPNLPFIMLTGSTNEEIAVECMRAGADDYLLKDKMKRLPFAIMEVMKSAQNKRQKQAIQKAREESERKYQLIAENSADVIFILDLNLNFTYISPSVLKQTGFTMEEAMKQSIDDTLTPESKQLVWDTFASEMELEASGKADPNRVSTLMLYDQHKDGHLIYTETTLSFIRDMDGTPVGILGISRDITDRKLAENKLSVSEERYRKLISEMNQGLAVHKIMLDENGKPVNYVFLDANPAFEKLTGLKRNEIVGKTVLDVLPNTEDYWIEQYGKVALSGQPISFENYAQELDQYFRVLAYQNEPNQFVTIVSDVTESRKVEEALRESELKFRMIAEHSADVIFLVDLNLNYTYISPAIERINGYTVEEMLDKSIPYMFTPESQKQVMALFEQEMKLEMSGTADPYRTRKIALDEYHKNGHIIHVESSLSFIRNNAGEAIGVMGITRDITDKVKAEEALSYASLIIKNSPVVAILWENKNNGKAVYVSDNCEKVLGFKAADIMADKPNFKEIIHPDETRRVADEVSENKSKKNTKSFRHKPYRIIKPDGEVIWVDDLTTIIRNQTGEITHFQGIISNVTERVLFEQEQQKLNDSLNHAQQIAKLGSWESELVSSKQVWSDNYFRILGLEVNEIEPSSTYFWEHVHPGDIELVKKMADKAIAQNQACDFEYRFLLPDGNYIWLQNSIMPVIENGVVSKLKGVSMDITRQKQTEAQVLQTSERLKKLAAQVPGVVYEYQLWPDGHSAFLYSSPGMWEIYECKPEDLVEDASPVFDRLHPDDFERISQTILESAEQQTPYKQEFRVILPEQGPRWRLSDARPQKMPDGSTLWYGIISDITDRKQAEELISKKQAELHQIFEHVPAGLLSFDKEGKIVDCNEHFVGIIGSSKDKLLGLNMTLLPDKKMSQAVYEALAGKNSTYEDLYTSYTADKQTDVYVQFAPVFDQGGAVIGGVGIVEDMTERIEAEKAIKESEERYRMVYNNSPIGIINYNSQGMLIDCNQRFLEIIGSTREKVFGLDLSNLKNKSVVQCIFDTLENKTTIYEGPYEPLTGNRIAEVHMRFSPLFDVNNQIVGGVGVVEDVTERKQAEESLKETAHQLERITTAAKDAIVMLDEDGRVNFWNLSAERIFGYTKAEIMGKNFHKLIVPKSYWPEHEKAFPEFVRFGKGNAIGKTLELEAITKSGKQIAVELSLSGIEYKNHWRAVGLLRDITKRKETDLKLKQSDRIFNHAMDMLCMAGFDGYFKTLNPAWSHVLGYSTEELLAKPWLEFVHPEDKETTENVKATLVDGKEIYQFENRYVCKDGSVKWLSWNSYPYKEEGVMFGVVRDVTQQKKNDQALKESEQLFSKTFFNSPVALLISRLSDNLMIEANDAFCRLTGFTRDQLLTTTPSDLRITDKEIHHQLYHELLQKDRIMNVEFPVYTRTGEQRIVLLSAEKIGLKGDPHVLISMLDITERKSFEAELSKLSSAVEQSPVSIIITNLEGIIEYVNPRACEVTGYYAHELVGQNPRILNSGEKSEVEYKQMYESISRGETWHGEFHNKKKNGELYWESASISPVINDKGEMTNYIAVKEDITERKKLQADLVQSELRYRDMFASNPVPMWVYDVDTLAFVEVNDAAVNKYGYSEEEFLNMTLKDIRPVEDIPLLMEDIRVSHDHYQKSQSWRHQLKDGSIIEVEINSHNVIDEEGRKLRLVLANDITERAQAAKALEQAVQMAEASNRLKTTFLNNISHEVRTPLNGILGVMSLLADPDMDAEEREDLNEIVTVSSERLMQTITDYMDISLLTSGNMEKSIKHMPVLQAFERICRKYVPAIQAKGLELIMDVPENAESHFVDTDEEMVGKVLGHLLSNALKFTANGSIRAGYTLRENDMVFFVQDTGKGIKDEYKDKLFDVFSQEEEGNVRKFEGSGLGLAIIRGIADLLGAEIRVESALGEGSTFYFGLPYKYKSAEVGEIKPKLAEEKAQQPKILIAEDDDSNYQVLELMMRKMTNAITLRANDGQEAVEIFKDETDIDLILMDLKMPNMDGFEATKQIRKMDANIPIIAITAFAMSGDERRAIEAGCNDYLAKPVTMKVLLNKLAEFGLKKAK